MCWLLIERVGFLPARNKRSEDYMTCTKSKWAVRDIEHGKIFFFAELLDLIKWVKEFDDSEDSNEV